MKSGGVPGLPVHDEQGRPSVTIVIVVGCTDHLLTPREAVELCERVSRAARRLALPAAVVAAAFLIWTIAVAVDRNDKDVFPVILPAAIAIVALALAAYLVYAGKSGLAFAMTAGGTVAVVATLFTGLYPRVMVSSPDFGNSLTVGGASSAHYTLAVMSVVALIVTPVVLLYQGWTYRVFRHRLGGDEPAPQPGS